MLSDNYNEKLIFDLDKTNVMVEFRIIGEGFNPQFITESLKIIPD